MGGYWSLSQASSCMIDFTHIYSSTSASFCVEQRAKEPLPSARSKGSSVCHSCHLPPLHVVHGWANTPPCSFSVLNTGMQSLFSSATQVSGMNIFRNGRKTNIKKTILICRQESWLNLVFPWIYMTNPAIWQPCIVCAGIRQVQHLGIHNRQNLNRILHPSWHKP